MIARRVLLLAGAGWVMAPGAHATPQAVEQAIRAVIGNAAPHSGRVKLDIPLLVENGNSVSITVSVIDMPPDASVIALHVFAEANPLPNVFSVRFGVASGAPRFATRIRLAYSQTVRALAVCADGTVWEDSVDLIVTLAACLD